MHLLIKCILIVLNSSIIYNCLFIWRLRSIFLSTILFGAYEFTHWFPELLIMYCFCSIWICEKTSCLSTWMSVVFFSSFNKLGIRTPNSAPKIAETTASTKSYPIFSIVISTFHFCMLLFFIYNTLIQCTYFFYFYIA